MNITAKTKICMIVGDPVEHSLSPAMHNAAYKALGIDNEFVFTGSTVSARHIKEIVDAVRTLNIRGLTCTMPHKIKVMQYLDNIDPIAQQIGAVNTVVNDNGVLTGYNTDWLGVTKPLAKAIGGDREFINYKFAILGAGGAARAAAFGIAHQGGNIAIFNRSIKNAQKLADDIGHALNQNIPAYRLSNSEKISEYDVIFNGTPLGMGNLVDQTPVSQKYLGGNDHKIIFDSIYNPTKTRLLKEAEDFGAFTISGIEMLLHQGTAQFELYTGHKAPEKVMRKSLIK